MLTRAATISATTAASALALIILLPTESATFAASASERTALPALTENAPFAKILFRQATASIATSSDVTTVQPAVRRSALTCLLLKSPRITSGSPAHTATFLTRTAPLLTAATRTGTTLSRLSSPQRTRMKPAMQTESTPFSICARR